MEARRDIHLIQAQQHHRFVYSNGNAIRYHAPGPESTNKQLWHSHEVDMEQRKHISTQAEVCVIIVLLHQLINTN